MLNMLRKAGQGVLDFDQKYATAVQDLIMRYMPEKLAGPLAMTAGAPLQTGVRLAPGDNPIIARAIQSGMITSGAAARYGVPIAGAYGIANVLGRGYDALSTVPVIGGNANGQHKAALDEMLKNGQISQEQYERML